MSLIQCSLSDVLHNCYDPATTQLFPSFGKLDLFAGVTRLHQLFARKSPREPDSISELSKNVVTEER